MATCDGKIRACNLKLVGVHDSATEIVASEPISTVGIGEGIESMVYVEAAVS